jgi:hypothetical protein
MKLFVWTDVLCDYSCGMIVALAPDLETALPLAESSTIRGEMGSSTPEVIDLGPVAAEPKVWHVWGGG